MSWLRVLFTPGLWLRNDPTSKVLSAFIVSSLAQGWRPQIVNEYILTLRGVPIWRGNWPYGYGSLYLSAKSDEVEIEKRLPSRRVALLLRDAERDAEQEAVGTVDDRTREYLARTASARGAGLRGAGLRGAEVVSKDPDDVDRARWEWIVGMVCATCIAWSLWRLVTL